MNTYCPVSAEVVSHLAQLVGERNISTRQSDLDLHAQDQSAHEAQCPEVIVWVENADQVSRVLAYANGKRISITAWGAGTSLEGNPIALYGGILVSFARMNKIVAIHEDNFQVTVQPGLGYKDLNTQLARHGLFFAPDPGANASRRRGILSSKYYHTEHSMQLHTLVNR
jgi:D-lactate dehydrogenase (cytochrome)